MNRNSLLTLTAIIFLSLSTAHAGGGPHLPGTTGEDDDLHHASPPSRPLQGNVHVEMRPDQLAAFLQWQQQQQAQHQAEEISLPVQQPLAHLALEDGTSTTGSVSGTTAAEEDAPYRVAPQEEEQPHLFSRTTSSRDESEEEERSPLPNAQADQRFSPALSATRFLLQEEAPEENLPSTASSQGRSSGGSTPAPSTTSRSLWQELIDLMQQQEAEHRQWQQQQEAEHRQWQQQQEAEHREWQQRQAQRRAEEAQQQPYYSALSFLHGNELARTSTLSTERPDDEIRDSSLLPPLTVNQPESTSSSSDETQPKKKLTVGQKIDREGARLADQLGTVMEDVEAKVKREGNRLGKQIKKLFGDDSYNGDPTEKKPSFLAMVIKNATNK